MRAIEAATDALYRRDRCGAALAEACSVLCSEEETRKAAARRRADALGLLAERALAAGFGGAALERDGAEGARADGDGADPAPISGTRAERFQVVVHVEEATLMEKPAPRRTNSDPECSPKRWA